MEIRQKSLIFAEAFDAWRIVPRLMILCYGWIVLQLYIWFKSIPTYVQEKCDPAVLNVALEKAMSLPEAKALACTVVDVVGGPTSAQSAFVTTVIGLSTGIFGLYTATGRRWDGWEPSSTYDRNIARAQVEVYDPYNQNYSVQNGPMTPMGPTPAPATQINVYGEGEQTEEPTPTKPVIRVPDGDVGPTP